MATNYTLDSLKKDSLRVYDGMLVVYPTMSAEEPLSNIAELLPKFPGRNYAVNNSTVSFICDGEMFVTPYTTSAMQALRSAYFHERHFYVPFSNCDYPKYEQYQWSKLRAKARKAFEEEFLAECASYCDSHGIKAISDEVLSKCFEMPTCGVMVKHLYYQSVYYPILVNNHFHSEKMGVFTSNNGLTVFVHRNGKTYVARSKKVNQDLIDAGYKETNTLFVPFSNSEQILDPALKSLWEFVTM